MKKRNATYSFEQLEFAIFCIENVAKKLNKNPVNVYDSLKKSGILESYIVDNYEALHTQGKGYITDDIISAMNESGAI